MTASVIAPALDVDERAELETLRAMRDDLARPVMALAAELAHLRDVEAATRKAVDRGEQHARLGYSRIRVGVFDELRTLLAANPRYVAASNAARDAR